MPLVRRDLLVEGVCATIGLVVLVRLVLAVAVLRPAHTFAFLLVCCYGPIGILLFRRRRMALCERGCGAFWRGVGWAVGTAAVVFPLFALAAHGWQTEVAHLRFVGWAAAPSCTLILTQLCLVGLPEEFFFRGYLQPTLEEALAADGRGRWRILGTNLGWGWVVASLLFAFAHSAIAYQWWHFAIFFPGLLFGYLRARTGGLTAPICFHATSNLVMDWIARSYA